MARSSSASSLRCSPMWRRRSSMSVALIEASVVRNAGSALSAARSAVRSRGRADFNATRARTRSISPIGDKASRKDRCVRESSNSVIASCRCRSSAWSVIGRLSKRRSARAPIAVTVVSSKASSVASSRPCALESISRWRRVMASRCRLACRSSTRSARKCGSAVRCVSRTYCNNAPAAATASGIERSPLESMPKPCRSSVPSCSVSRRRAVSSSKCHGARPRQVRLPVRSRNGAPISPSHSSGTSSSAGCSRSSSATSAESP